MVKSTLTLPLELNLGIRFGYPSNREYKSRQLAPHMLLMCPHPDQGILLCYGGHTYKGIPVQCIPLAITCCHFHTRRSDCRTALPRATLHSAIGPSHSRRLSAVYSSPSNSIKSSMRSSRTSRLRCQQNTIMLNTMIACAAAHVQA